MAFDIGSGVQAAKSSFLTIGLPLVVGAFFVALIAGLIGMKVE